jgi:hypothetical protein
MLFLFLGHGRPALGYGLRTFCAQRERRNSPIESTYDRSKAMAANLEQTTHLSGPELRNDRLSRLAFTCLNEPERLCYKTPLVCGFFDPGGPQTIAGVSGINVGMQAALPLFSGFACAVSGLFVYTKQQWVWVVGQEVLKCRRVLEGVHRDYSIVI